MKQGDLARDRYGRIVMIGKSRNDAGDPLTLVIYPPMLHMPVETAGGSGAFSKWTLTSNLTEVGDVTEHLRMPYMSEWYYKTRRALMG